MNNSVIPVSNRVIEREYWTDIYIYLNRYLSDPLYHAQSFWYLNCDFIESIYLSLSKTEKDRLQMESVSTAYLTDTVLSIVHSLYGKDGEKYKSQPQVFLPGYQPEKSDDDVEFSLNPATIEILMSEIDLSRIPQFAIMHLSPYIPKWREKIEYR